MMCESCKLLADESRRRQEEKPGGANRHTSHTRKKKPHCEYPQTCTCQHRPITAKGYTK